MGLPVNRFYIVSVMSCITFCALTYAPAGAVEVRGIGEEKVQSQTKFSAKNKKTDASCDAADATKHPSAPQQETRSCLVALPAIDRLRAGKDFSFVDVRSPEEFARFHIADSINVPLHLVKTKAFLKSQSFVLVNEGRSTADLEKTCSELKQAGFDRVAVMEGGLFGWYVSKRALQGDPVAQSRLNRMTPGELFEAHAGSAMSDWSVIDVSTPGKYKDMRPWLPVKVLAFPLKAKGDPIANIFSSILQQRKRNPRVKLLLIADDNETYDRIDSRLKKSGIAPSVLRLDRGFKGYREQVTKQVALWDQQKQPRRYSACRG